MKNNTLNTSHVTELLYQALETVTKSGGKPPFLTCELAGLESFFTGVNEIAPRDPFTKP